MLLLAHETQEDADAAARCLSELGASARRLLERCVASQGECRKSLSGAANALSDAGFLFIRDIGDKWSPQFMLCPSLSGEEALEALEQSERMNRERTV